MPEVRFLLEDLLATVPEGATVLDAARAVGAPQGSHCAGVGACSTCHVVVRAGGDLLSAPDEIEADLLDLTHEREPGSRLGCQARLRGEGRVEVTISRESFQTFLDQFPAERDRALALRGKRA